MQYNILFGRPFRTFLTALFVNPTFRFASCGAEISCPFGTTTQHEREIILPFVITIVSYSFTGD
ncbi:hypothetical protein Barb4_01910 [Bacteroidales bacterium Barb4]|nr:hypothetical protein Barb4_01910 [Bacteroidales bacterium Barb4]